MFIGNFLFRIKFPIKSQSLTSILGDTLYIHNLYDSYDADLYNNEMQPCVIQESIYFVIIYNIFIYMK